MSKKKKATTCIECGKEEVYSKKLCQACYMADYRALHPEIKFEDMTEDEKREALKTPISKCNTDRQCHFCERRIPPKFAWCIGCAVAMPIVICPKCGRVCYLADRYLCLGCGTNLLGTKKLETGIIGISQKRWPEWLRFLKNDLDREYRDDIRAANKGVDLYDEETEELHKGVGKMEYQEFTEGADKRHLDKSDLPLAEVLEKYGFTKEEYLVMTTWDLRKLSGKMNITYSAIRKRKERLVRRGEKLVLLMMINGAR